MLQTLVDSWLLLWVVAAAQALSGSSVIPEHRAQAFMLPAS